MIPLGILGSAHKSGGWTPASLPNLWGWWKADALSLADGAPVASWVDSSGNGRTVTQADTSLQPTYASAGLNGLPSVMFSNDRLLNSGQLPASSASIFIAAQPNTVGLMYAEAFSSSVGIGAQEGNQINLKLPGRDDLNAASSWLTTGPTEASVRYDITTNAYTIRRGGSVVGTGTTSNPPMLRSSCIGAAGSSGGDPWPGYISEIVVYSAALSDADMSEVDSYLKTKWGIA